jgi:hypothetical protein
MENNGMAAVTDRRQRPFAEIPVGIEKPTPPPHTSPRIPLKSPRNIYSKINAR